MTILLIPPRWAGRNVPRTWLGSAGHCPPAHGEGNRRSRWRGWGRVELQRHRAPEISTVGAAPPPPAARGVPLPSGRNGGFTLVELMVVLVIIGLLATIVIINVMPAADRAATTKARADIATLEQALEMYRLDNQHYPTTAEGLQSLVAGRYVRRLPNDPWNHPYRYAVPGRNGQPFSIATWGADDHEGGSGTNADIFN
jgi:general secretion pathway protein G